jgi:hypothetical protein
LNHGTFLFGEEIFVAENARKFKLHILYEPALTVFHREHATTGISATKTMWRYVRDAAAYCANEFF